MAALTEKCLDVPDNVPPELIRDFDLYNIPGLVDGVSENIHKLWKKVQDTHPAIFWTPHYGGHWVITRYWPMRDMLLDPDNFSNADSFLPRGVAPRLIPVQLDPPEHGKYRRILNPYFTPEAIEKASQTARQTAVEIIEELKPKGQCEFVSEFASVMPVVTFLTLVNLPVADMDYLKKLGRRMMPTSPEIVEAYAELDRYLAHQLEQRREHPQEDFLTSLLSAQVDNRRLNQDEIESIARLVVSGGLDTVALVTTFTANFLAQHPQHCRELIEHPELMDNAVEEFLRCFGPSNLGRLVRNNLDFHGVKFHKDDFVLGLFPMGGWDESINSNPAVIDFARKSPRYLTFGFGPHMCIGNRLAKREIKLFLQEWLARIPEFHLATGFTPKMMPGMLNQMPELRLEWAAV